MPNSLSCNALAACTHTQTSNHLHRFFPPNTCMRHSVRLERETCAWKKCNKNNKQWRPPVHSTRESPSGARVLFTSCCIFQWVFKVPSSVFVYFETHKKNTCIHVALYGGCGAAVTAAATTAFICVFLTIKSSTKSNTIVSQSLMHKCYCACLTTESMHQQQSNRTSAPCAVFSISSRQIYTSSHSLNNNNKHTLSHLIFPMTPSLLLLPLQPSSMPPPALPLLYSPPEFTNNPMVLGMVRRNSIHSTPMHVLFSPFSSHRMLCFVLFCCFCCVIV